MDTAVRSIDFGVAAANLALVQRLECLVFGALEQQVAGQQLSAEPVRGRRCLFQQGQRLRETRRQRAAAARVDFAPGPDTVDTRLHHGCQRQVRISGGIAYAELDVELAGVLRRVCAVQRCDSNSRAAIGDAVLGEGSVFISPDPGALIAYLAGLDRLRSLRPLALCPGHGPVVNDPETKLSHYIDHRLERERRLLDALDQGRRSVEELLDGAWSDAPAELRPLAAVTLAAHLDKLAAEGRLPDGVERPAAWPADST